MNNISFEDLLLDTYGSQSLSIKNLLKIKFNGEDNWHPPYNIDDEHTDDWDEYYGSETWNTPTQK